MFSSGNVAVMSCVRSAEANDVRGWAEAPVTVALLGLKDGGCCVKEGPGHRL